MGASTAGAFSIAPKAIEKGCLPGAECVTEQPATPAWLTFANGRPLLAQESLEGVAAAEYGSEATADTSLYGSAQAYPNAPEGGAGIVDSVLIDLARTKEPGDLYSVILRSDRTLEVLGPQKEGYKRIAKATVPSEGELAGVVVYAAPENPEEEEHYSASEEVLVFTKTSGIYAYGWEKEELVSRNSSPEWGRLAGLESGNTAGDPAFECSVFAACTEPAGAGEWHFRLPEGSEVLDVYQAPPGKSGYGALSTFAIAYTGSSLGTKQSSYTVSVFRRTREDRSELVYEAQELFPTEKVEPLGIAFAASQTHLRVASVAAASTGTAKMVSFEEKPITASQSLYNNPPKASNTGTCQTEAGALPALGVDVLRAPSAETRLTGASLCAAIVEGRVDSSIDGTEVGGNAVSGSNPTGTLSFSDEGNSFTPPAGLTAKALVASIQFPCEETLVGFAEHPTPDGYPDISTTRYCAPVKGEEGTEPFRPEDGAAAILAAQIGYVAEGSAGAQLRMHSATFTIGEGEPRGKGATSGYDASLAALPASASPSLTMLPLGTGMIRWNAYLVTNGSGEAAHASASASPVPVAVLAAPPYYTAAEQQVTPTAVTFANSECGGTKSEQENSVGIEVGIDAEFGKIFEIEALAKAEYAWSTETAIDTCKSFDQQFITGNFSNNFVAQNSLLFRVDTGTDTYLNLRSSSLGLGLTGECSFEHLDKCYPVFDPTRSQYGIQTITQLRKPQPNNVYAATDRTLEKYYGESLESLLPDPGNPASYPSSSSGCAGPPQGPGSENPGISEYNPFVEPTKPEPPNGLLAPQVSEVNPASAGNQAGTSSTLSYDSTTEQSASADFKVGAEVSLKAGFFKEGVEYSHGWGAEVSQSFQTGTEFTGGVYDFNGFYNPYGYRLYECKASLRNTFGAPGTKGVGLPVFLVDYTTEPSSDGLPLNFVTTSGSLAEGTQGQEYAGQVFASGGSPPYTYKIVSGALPPGLSLDETTGEVSGTPSEAGTFGFTVRATDSLASISSESESITIRPPLGIASTLPEGEVGKPYEQSLGGTGGQPPYTYLLTSGPLPPGLALNGTTGMLEGTPAESGAYCFDVYVGDSALPQDTSEAKTCVKIGDTLNFTPESLPPATVGQLYRVVLQGSGGNASGYDFYTDTSTPLPPRLHLLMEEVGTPAVLGGTPETAGEYTFTIELSDGAGGHAERAYTLKVVEPSGITALAPKFKSVEPVTLDVGVPASISVKAEGSPAPVITQSGTLPEGLSFSGGKEGSAEIEGTPAAGSTGTYTVTLTAQNGVEPEATQTLTITVDERPAITTEPADQTAVAPGGSASFTAAASGRPRPTVIWEESTDGGTSWTPILTAMSDTLELTGLEAGANGEEFRAAFESSQGKVISQPATLTVDFAPVIEAQPSNATVNVGGEASFSAAAAGQPAPAAQWQLSTDGGSTWTDISGASAATLTLPSVPASDSGNSYRVLFTNAQGSVMSQAAVLSVQTAPAVSAQPAGDTVLEGGEASFSAAASGSPVPSVQWRVSTDGGAEWVLLSGATSSTLHIADVPGSENGNQYDAVFTNPAGSVTTESATLHVQAVPQITLQPVAQTAPAGGNATFIAAASGRPSPTVQWQLSADGGRTWTDISGATSPSLALLDLPAADDGQLYRALFTNPAGTATTQPALLTVQSAAGVSAPPSSTVAAPGGSATFTVQTSGSPPPAIQWQLSKDGGASWIDIPGATSPTLNLTHLSVSESGFLYRAIVSNSQGTVITSPATLIVGTPAAVRAARKACRRAPAHMIFLNRRLGRVTRYTVFVDGRRVRTVHGRSLRYAKLPKLRAGWHAIRIIAFTVRGFRITTRRLYVECVKGIGVNKVRRRVHRRRAHRHHHARRRHRG